MKAVFKKLFYLLHSKEENSKENLPTNYFLILLSNTATKLGDTLSNPKTVLTWVMSFVNAPVYLISLIVPIRESGSMLPQIFLASVVKKKKQRKYVYVFGAVLQFVSVLAMGCITLFFKDSFAGWLLIIALIVFSFSRSLCSISSKDVLGKTIPKNIRGKLKGYIVSIAGILVLLAGLFMLYKSKTDANVYFYSVVLFVASSMWLLAAILFATIKEPNSKKSENKESFKEVLQRINLLRKDAHFRHFIIARSLLLCSALTAPFYILLTQKHIGKDLYLLGLFIVANGIAAILSAPFWGKLADLSSKNVMASAVSIASVLGILIFMLIYFYPMIAKEFYIYPIAFFILGIAHSGVRLGRKTYIVNMAEGNKRTDYVAVSNTIIGVILLITGGISALVSIISVEGVLLVLSIFGLFGAFASYKLKNVEA
ncbi:MFS transporter [Polaribacter sp.]|uniref:MFS transporter n=1 Tax=Polaribacter sp. TaxID=1920175 RepID=UPI003F6C2B3C